MYVLSAVDLLKFTTLFKLLCLNVKKIYTKPVIDINLPFIVLGTDAYVAYMNFK